MATSPTQHAEQQELRVKELAELIESKWPGFKVNHQWDFDKHGLHVRLERTPEDTREFIIANEVLEDHTPKQIINGLDANNWMILLGECRGKVVPRFTNKGWV